MDLSSKYQRLPVGRFLLLLLTRSKRFVVLQMTFCQQGLPLKKYPAFLTEFVTISNLTQTLDLGLTSESGDELAHLITTPFTRNIEVKFPDVRDEIIVAFSDHIPVKNDGNRFLIFQYLWD